MKKYRLIRKQWSMSGIYIERSDDTQWKIMGGWDSFTIYKLVGNKKYGIGMGTYKEMGTHRSNPYNINVIKDIQENILRGKYD